VDLSGSASSPRDAQHGTPAAIPDIGMTGLTN
jgi:hypothetical protein